jgi:hypothetical protein
VTLRLAVATAFLVGFAAVARAESPSPEVPSAPPPPRIREGVVGGVGLGVGNLSASSCIGCGTGGALEVHVGGMLNPSFALVADFWYTSRDFPTGKASQVLYVFAVQRWVTDRLWLKIGAGGGVFSNTTQAMGMPLAVVHDDGLGLVVAAGVEVAQFRTFALDLQVRLGRGYYGGVGRVNDTGFLVGADWR